MPDIGYLNNPDIACTKEVVIGRTLESLNASQQTNAIKTVGKGINMAAEATLDVVTPAMGPNQHMADDQ
jgi:hypothetical protein